MLPEGLSFSKRAFLTVAVDPFYWLFVLSKWQLVFGIPPKLICGIITCR
jgi:hypothetical protein